MSEQQRAQLTEDLRVHAQEIERISRSLAGLATLSRADKQVVFLTAQVTRHRISMALLAAQLEEPLPVP